MQIEKKRAEQGGVAVVAVAVAVVVEEEVVVVTVTTAHWIWGVFGHQLEQKSGQGCF